MNRLLTLKTLKGYRGLKGKFFLALAITALGVIVSTFLVLNYFLRREVFATLNVEVRRSAKLFAIVHQRERIYQMLEKGRVLTSAPQLRAALDTDDPLTVQIAVQDVLERLLKTVATITEENGLPDSPTVLNRRGESVAGAINELSVVYDRAGKILAVTKRLGDNKQILRGATTGFILSDSTVVSTLQGRELFTTWRNQDGVWWGVQVPIWTDESSPLGPSILGGLIFGMQFNDAFAERMKDLVGADVAFVIDRLVVAASFSGETREQITAMLKKNSPVISSGQPQELQTENENFLAISLPWFERHQNAQVILLRSVTRSIQPLLQPVQRTLFIVGLGAFLSALLISLAISRTITQPIAKLVDAAHAAGTGHLDQPIQITSRDEIGYLARRFEAMRQSLKQQMEKLTELNADLRDRNVELEQALEQLRRAQEDLVQSEKLAAAGKLTAQLSHEINNPIHNIRSGLETALKKMPEQLAGRQFVQLAHDEILRIGKLVRQMLDFYRFGQIELQAVDLNAALNEVLESSQRRFEEYHIQVERFFAEDLPTVHASRDQMKQVFLNLLLNAIEAMPAGGKLVTRSWRENGRAQIAIRDSGCGIPPENLSKIFDTFFTTKRAVHGVGLGLSVCYNIVHQHGGTLEVESEVGKGSVFTIKLPVAEKLEPT